MKHILIAFVVAASTLSGEQQPQGPPAKPLTVQEYQRIERSLAAAQAELAKLEADAAARQARCMNAIGSHVFCACIVDNLPDEVDLRMYVAIATTSQKEYDGLAPDVKKIVDVIIAVRNKCVAAAFPQPK